MMGLITGSGFYDLPDVVGRASEAFATPYGSVMVTTGQWGGVPVAFLPRHGSDHSVPPHAINYRANIWALKEIGASAILATAVCGGINPALTPGRFVIISDILNFTSGRADTFFDGSDGTVTHTDMSYPYDPVLRRILLDAASAEAVDAIDGGIYCATNGPRFETPAEIAMMGRLGGELVGMTGYPEVVLANELEVPYAAIGVISNTAAGLGDDKLTMDDVIAVIGTCADPLHRLVGRAVALWGATA
jgi:5'-methylthioadenosine phosphorylase